MKRPHEIAWGCCALFLIGCKTVTTEDGAPYIPDGEQHSYVETRLEKLEALAKKYPKDPDYHYQIAAIRFEQAEYDESAVALERAIALTDEQPSSRYYYQLGRCLLHQHELERAQKSFQKAVELSREERFTGPRAALAYVQALRGETDSAIANFKQCVRIDPEETSFYYFLGALHDMKQDDATAIRYFREYLDRGGGPYSKKATFLLDRMGIQMAGKDLYGLDGDDLAAPEAPAQPEGTLPPEFDSKF